MTAGTRVEPNWLDDDEMRAWRNYVVGSSLLEYHLHRELQDAHDLALADYEILVRLAERADNRMRMSELAAEVASSKSRVSHQISRLQHAGLVQRIECPSDGRGVFAVLTDRGAEVLQRAAPTHADGVRRLLIDLLDVEEQAILGRVFARVTQRLGGDRG